MHSIQIPSRNLNQAQLLALKALQQMGQLSAEVQAHVLEEVGQKYPDAYERQQLENGVLRVVHGALRARNETHGQKLH